MTYNLVKSIDYVQQCRHGSNEEQLKAFDHLFIIEKGEVWKQEAYYKRSEDAPKLRHLRHASFAKFLKEAFSISIRWYNSIKRILAEGESYRAMFIAWGRENMVTYMKCTPNQQKAILNVALKSVTSRRFSSIKYDLYPPKKKSKAHKVESLWKRRHDMLLSRHKRMIADRDAKIENLKRAIRQIEGVSRKAATK